MVRTVRTGARGGALNPASSASVCRLFLGGIDQVQDHVGVAKRVNRGGAHDLLERDGGLEEAGRVDEHDLGVVEGEDAGDAIARGLGALARNGELLADEPVEERRLTHVRLADDGDESGFTDVRWEMGDL